MSKVCAHMITSIRLGVDGCCYKCQCTDKIALCESLQSQTLCLPSFAWTAPCMGVGRKYNIKTDWKLENTTLRPQLVYAPCKLQEHCNALKQTVLNEIHGSMVKAMDFWPKRSGFKSTKFKVEYYFLFCHMPCTMYGIWINWPNTQWTSSMLHEKMRST